MATFREPGPGSPALRRSLSCCYPTCCYQANTLIENCPGRSLSSVRLSKNGCSAPSVNNLYKFSRFRAVSYAAVWCEPFCLRLRSCYLPQHAGRIVQTGVSGLDSGGQSLPLRHVFCFVRFAWYRDPETRISLDAHSHRQSARLSRRSGSRASGWRQWLHREEQRRPRPYSRGATNSGFTHVRLEQKTAISLFPEGGACAAARHQFGKKEETLRVHSSVEWHMIKMPFCGGNS